MLLDCGTWEDSHWESLDSKEIKSVNLKGNQPWILIGRTDAEAKAPILWLPDVKSWLTGKDPDTGKDWQQEKKQSKADEIVGWHHWLNDMSSSELWEIVEDRGTWCATVHGVTKSQTGLTDWPTTVTKTHWYTVNLFMLVDTGWIEGVTLGTFG